MKHRLHYALSILEWTMRSLPLVLSGEAIVRWHRTGKTIFMRCLLREEQTGENCEEWEEWVNMWEEWVKNPEKGQR